MSYGRIVVLAALVLGVAHTQLSLSGQANEYTEDNLPELCAYVQLGSRRNATDTARYSAIFGEEAFHSMHHYCWGLVDVRLALQNRDGENLRLGNLRNAVSNFDYVLERTDSTFVMRAEILVRKGSALLLMDETRTGLQCFQDALEVQPDFLPAYIALSNYFAGAGEIEEARRVLETGLERVPNGEMLERKLSRLR